MSCGIYKITNLINQHSYIGQSINIENRWKKEKSGAYNVNGESFNTSLSKAFRKYGIENFSFEILEECEVNDLDEKEIYYINYYNTYFNGYNNTTGGQSGNGNNCIKISKNDLLLIYDLLQNSELSQKEIAKRFNVGQDVISTINHGKSRRLDGYQYPLRNNKSKSKKIYCCDCGKEISQGAIRCDTCNKKLQRVVERPEREELKKLIRTMPFTQIAKLYNVSDKAIVKWCTHENLPSRKKDIRLYSDEEWQKI